MFVARVVFSLLCSFILYLVYFLDARVRSPPFLLCSRLLSSTLCVCLLRYPRPFPYLLRHPTLLNKMAGPVLDLFRPPSQVIPADLPSEGGCDFFRRCLSLCLSLSRSLSFRLTAQGDSSFKVTSQTHNPPIAFSQK